MYDASLFAAESPLIKSVRMSPVLKPDFYENQAKITRNLIEGVAKYNNEFLFPFLIASNYFSNVELSKLFNNSSVERFNSYMDLFEFNVDLITRYFTGSYNAMDEYYNREMKNYVEAIYNTFFNLEGENLEDFYSRQAGILETVTQTFPKAIQDIEPEFGFHFERNENTKVTETSRFILYKIAPTDPKISVDDKMKPVLIIPPFVLGYNILSFLPREKTSYTHSFANQGIPTYIRIVKNIANTPEVQTMTIEEDALDTKYFCQNILEAHGKQVTLNGYCQGGFSAVCNHLSGELDGLVDSIITCVSPMDGTRSRGLGVFLKNLPQRFNDLVYGTKTLPNGNNVADGDLMGWVYKLKSIEEEAPIVSFFRDIFMVATAKNKPRKISKTAAALNYWLQNERSDLPLSIAQMSFASYNKPVKEDGTLPVEMFGRKLNFTRIKEKKIAWLICYGETDDLVEKETALAPLDYIDAEVTKFPKGHVAIATSWSRPDSECGLHTRFGKENYRGPVRFQLDLNIELDKAIKKASKKSKAKPTKQDTSSKKGQTDKNGVLE